MRAHADDLRDEVDDQELVAAVERAWRRAPLERISARARVLCEHAARLTTRPHEIGAGDIAALRAAGCDDATITDVTNVVALFSYYNRIADGLGVDPEPDW